MRQVSALRAEMFLIVQSGFSVREGQHHGLQAVAGGLRRGPPGQPRRTD